MIPFITVGDPDADSTLDIMRGLVANGADAIELGVPFSDPAADGPIIQRASERALAQGISLADVLRLVQAFRQQNETTPVILMGYLNPVEMMGYERFAEQAKQHGVDGVLLVDMPAEEAAELNGILARHGLHQIFLISPTTTDSRFELILKYASGFVYYVAVKGVTGKHNIDIREIKNKIVRLKQYTTLPIGVGFGISDASAAAAVADFSDAVIIGSALIEHINHAVEHEQDIRAGITAFLTPIRTALDEVA